MSKLIQRFWDHIRNKDYLEYYSHRYYHPSGRHGSFKAAFSGFMEALSEASPRYDNQKGMHIKSGYGTGMPMYLSWRTLVLQDNKYGLVVKLANLAPQARWLWFGTQRHDIGPRKEGGRLSFWWGKRTRTGSGVYPKVLWGPKRGDPDGFFSFKKVNHPGIQAIGDDILERAADIGLPLVDEALRASTWSWIRQCAREAGLTEGKPGTAPKKSSLPPFVEPLKPPKRQYWIKP